MDQPTAVNNVETLCCGGPDPREGADWFAAMGTSDSTGTKLLSVSGDCEPAGRLRGGVRPHRRRAPRDGRRPRTPRRSRSAGRRGTCVAPEDFGRKICFEDLPTGGSVIVFGPDRDLLEIACEFTEFFVEESCGWCAPCRVGQRPAQEDARRRSSRAAARGATSNELEQLGPTVKTMSRCGLGQTAPNPDPDHAAKLPRARTRPKVRKASDFVPRFDLAEAHPGRLRGGRGARPRVQGGPHE